MGNEKMFSDLVKPLPYKIKEVCEKYPTNIMFQMNRDPVYRITYKEAWNVIKRIAVFLRELGYKKGDMISVMGENSPEWALSYLGIAASGATIVPIDAHLKEDEIRHIMHYAGVKAIFVTPSRLSRIEEIKDKLPDLEYIFTTLPVEGYKSLTDIINTGDESEFTMPDIELDDTLVIIFTSGTTGKSKGVMLTHRNVIFDALSALSVIEITEGDSLISVLPLHHSFEATAGFITPLLKGAKITHARSLKSKEIIEDIGFAKATIMMGVPLLFEKFYNAINKKMEDLKGIQKGVVNGINGIVKISSKLGIKSTGKVLYKSIREKAGMGTLRLFVAGGAAMKPEVGEWFCKFGITLVQGYGLTETSPVLAVNPPDGKIKHNSIGPAMPGIEMKIYNPDSNGVGEIIAKGPVIMKGYYKNKEATDAIIKEGWLHTGDVGYKDKDGYFYISGRSKNIIVTGAGKNVFPEEIEEKLSESPFIEEIIIVGRKNNKGHEDIHAIIYPNFEAIDEEAEKRNIDPDVKESFVKDLLKEELVRIGKNMASYKRVKGFTIRDEEFPKTTTKKIKRYLFTEDFYDIENAED